MANENGGGGGFLLGFLLGGVTGAALALLFAPRRGEEVRGQLRERFPEMASSMDQVMGTSRSFLEQQLGTILTAVEEGRMAAQEATQELQRRFEEYRRQAQGQAPEEGATKGES